MPEIIIDQLGVTYGGTNVLRDSSFSVDEGEFLTLLGPSGCGKTTTLMSVAGMVSPTSGRILCGSEVFVDVSQKIELPPEQRNCGVVFQSYAIWSHMTVAANLAYPLKIRRVGKSERDRRVLEALNLVDMSRFADRYPHELSGGQQQRVALARAIVYSPGVLLLDEPLSNLDAKLREQARVWLKEIQQRTGLTTLFVTHDQGEALSLSDRVVVMSEGEIEQIGTPREVYHSPSTAFVADFIGSSNLIDAQIVSTGAGGCRVQLGRVGPVVDVVGEGSTNNGLREGAKVHLGVRPEAVAIVPAGTGEPSDGWFGGKVLSSMFMGGHYEHRVAVGDVEFEVRNVDHIHGADVELRVSPSSCSVFHPQEVTV